MYESDGSNDDGAYPWDLFIRNISLSVYTVELSIEDLSTDPPEEVVSCAATSEEHSELVFDLSPEKNYRLHASMEDHEASERFAGGLAPNEALEVTVEDGEFQIRYRHLDTVTVTS